MAVEGQKGENQCVPNGTAPSGLADHEVREEKRGDSQPPPKSSVKSFKTSLADVWFLITPYLLSCRIFRPLVEDAIKFAEYVARKLDSFFGKYENVNDIKFLDMTELLRSFAKEGLEFLQSSECEGRVMKYLVHTHFLTLETLDYAGKILESVVPNEPDVAPLLELDAAERCIRKKSLYLMVNFFHRLIKKMVEYAEDSYRLVWYAYELLGIMSQMPAVPLI